MGGNPVVQILLQDVTDQKRAENSLRQLTITDELTGAYNRRHLLYESALYLSSDGVASVPLSVVMLDIDHFKRINDGHGHAVGDLALKGLTRLMNAFVPTMRSDSAIFARVGGEEFVILLPGFHLHAAGEVAERARTAIEKLKVDYPDGTLSFTVSMGVAQYCPADGTFEETLRRADEALYCAKSAGRNVVRAAPQPRDPSASIPE